MTAAATAETALETTAETTAVTTVARQPSRGARACAARDWVRSAAPVESVGKPRLDPLGAIA